MGWERQKATVTNLPAAPSLTFWLIGGFAALIAGVLLFVLHANQLLGMWQRYDLWLLAGSPPAMWFVLICLRGWVYGHAVARYEFETQEAEHAQRLWVEWAGRHLAVLFSEVKLPGALTAAQMLATTERELHTNQSLRIDVHNDRGVLPLLLNNISEALTELPAELPLNVTLLTDSPEETAVLQNAFTACWQQLMPANFPLPALEVLRAHSFAAVERRLKSPDSSVELLLVQQMHGKERYSDALVTLLLTSDDVAAKYRLEHDVRLLRPMPLDMDNLRSDLTLFFSTQTQANAAQHIIGDSVSWGKCFPTLLAASENDQGSWKTEQLHWLEMYVGLSGPFSPWVTASVVSDMVRLQQSDCLMLVESEGESFINTVTTGTKKDKDISVL